MSPLITIAVDAMGGDFGPRVTVPASLSALSRHPCLHIMLYGREDKIKPYLKRAKTSLKERLTVVHCDNVISMAEKPSYALRKGKGSSMYSALESVANGHSDACVSAGNTGALMALGRLIIKTLPGIDRPALVSEFPTLTGHAYVLDLGANVDCSAEQLLQFAIMGSVMAEAADKTLSPRVALLNVGHEQAKGTEQVKAASRLINDLNEMNYIGFIEGDGIFSGRADVVVCDGFAGNILLKGSEGLSKMIRQRVSESFRRSYVRSLVGLLVRPILKELNNQMDPASKNGASLIGLQGTVLKSHGAADKRVFAYAIDRAVDAVISDLPARIKLQLSKHIDDAEPV